jgi:DNA-binding transcriptional LysR family regulator
MTDELDGLATFVAVAETRGFRAAGERLGISHSAVSQAVRRLEARLGASLVRRTTRSVHLTEAGERYYAAARTALDAMREASAVVSDLGQRAQGTLRLHAASPALMMLGESLLPSFLAEYPSVNLDLVVSEAAVDVIAEGFDAGIQLDEVIDRDLVAVPITGELRMVVVGAPSYFERRGVPRHPRELTEHDCLNWRASPTAAPYRWEFTDGGRAFTVGVSARVLSTSSLINRQFAVAGLGVTMAFDQHVRTELERGQLVTVLDKYCEPFAGYSLYYPPRRQASRALLALIDHVKRWRAAERRKRRW